MSAEQLLTERIRATKEALAEAKNTQGHLERQLQVLQGQLKQPQSKR